MRRIDRMSVLTGLVLSILAPSALSAGPIAKILEVNDPATTLTVGQRKAAQSLGEASRLLELGETAQARSALDGAEVPPSLVGYVELMRVHLLLKEGKHALAYQRASRAKEMPTSDALSAALAVLKGEALALGGDAKGAELAWKGVLGQAGAEDEAVRNSIELAIVASRQRTGSLDGSVDPLVLLDQSYADVAVASAEPPATPLSASMKLERAQSAFDARRTEQAIELFDAAISSDLEPDQVVAAKMGRARALFRARRYEEASNAFAGLLPEVEARFWYARTLARLGNVDGSLEEFGRVIAGGNDEFTSWALYLTGTLHEDRDEADKAIAAFRGARGYAAFPARARAAAWKEGWIEFRTGAYEDASSTLSELAGQIDEPLAQLRPRYWAARAAILSGEKAVGHTLLDQIARDYPLTYYGWRAQARLAKRHAALVGAKTESAELAEGTQGIKDEAIERVSLLLEANLEGLARDELRFLARDARGYVDRTRVGALLARVGDYHQANRLVLNAYSDSLAGGLQPGREPLWWLSWPPVYDDLIAGSISRAKPIDPELVWAIMREESHYRVDARSSAGALGLLQLMPATAAQLAKQQGLESFEAEDLFNPGTNIRLGSAYLAQLSQRFDGRVSAAIGSYNAGPRRVAGWLEGDGGKLEDDVWVEDIPFDQTRGYVKRVLRSLYVYKKFYRDE